MLKIGFMSNQLDNRGTGDALFNYAHYNEKILGNESIIYTLPHGNHDDKAFKRFSSRFDTQIIPFTSSSLYASNVDALYHIKSGYDDGFRTNNIPYLVHSVFDNQPHGTVYATISPWMGTRFGLPYVPHIVQTSNIEGKLKFGFPDDAVVFGRYGGPDTFDIPFVWETIYEYVEEHPNAFFIFMNTDKPARQPKNTAFLDATVDPHTKKMFINSCDAMIHARARGETFGLSVGEFAINGKPIITYSESHERAHLQELGHFALTYKDRNSLKVRFDQVMAGPLISWGYGQYTPENVMKKFDEVFLSCVK